MKQEDKDLLLRDLCVRLPYKVRCKVDKIKFEGELREIEISYNMARLYNIEDDESENVYVYDCKPYLFPLSSMTEEQREELYKIGWYLDGDKIYSCFRNYDDANYKTHTDCFELINWCYKNHIDINGLISMGLAIDATNKNIY